MDFSYLLKTAKIDKSLLLIYGFSEIKDEKAFEIQSESQKPKSPENLIPRANTTLLEQYEPRTTSYFLKKSFSYEGSNFFVNFEISSDRFIAKVYELESNDVAEPYVLFDVPSARGKFVMGVRQKVFDFVEDIKSKCFILTDVRKKYIQFIQNHFGTLGDNPFNEDSFDTLVFRTAKKSWFALLMTIKFKNLGIDSDELVSVVNLKHHWEKIPKIIDKKNIFNAYHMSKKHWITVILSDNIDFDFLKDLTKESFDLVSGKR